MGSKGVVTMVKEPEAEGETSNGNEILIQVYMSRLAKRVREARRHSNLKQSELGMLIGSNQSYIHLIEASQANVTLKNLVRLGQALNVNPENLLMPDQSFPILNVEKIQEVFLLVQKSIQEMRSTANYIARNDDILHQLHALLTEHIENLKIASISES